MYRIGKNVVAEKDGKYYVGSDDDGHIVTVGELPGVPQNPTNVEVREAFKVYLKKVLDI